MPPPIKLPPGAQLVDESQAMALPPGAELVPDAPVQDFSATKDNKEGVYQMRGPDGQLLSVPYSKVMSASGAGYKISPEDRIRFGQDKVYELSGKGQKGQFNPDTDLPQAFASVGATPKTPWYQPNWKGMERGALDLLPTAGGVAGGIAGGGAGLETGPGAIATGAAGAAAGGGIGEAVKEQAEETLFPFDHRRTAKETAKDIATQAGIQGANELTGRAGGKILSPAIGFFGKTALESSKSGIRLLPSEAAGKAPGYVEKFLKGSVLTRGMMETFREAQNKETQAAVQSLADKIAASKGTSEDVGKIIQDGIDQHKTQFRAVQKKLYDDIGTRVNERTIKVPVTTSKQVATGLMDSRGNPIYKTSTTTTLEDHLIDDVMPSTKGLKQFAAEELKKLNESEKILNPELLSGSRRMLQTIIDSPNTMTYNAMRTARSDTLAKVRELDQALAGKQAGLAKKMASLFDDSIMDAVRKSKIPGLEQQVRAADVFTAEEHRMFEQALVKKIVETKKPEAIATLIRGNAVGNQELRDAFSVIPQKLHTEVQRQILIDTMRQSTNLQTKIFNERRFADTLGKLGDERGKIIFGSNWKNVKELTGILERINGPTGLEGGTGASLQNMTVIKEILAAAGGAAFATGHYGAAGVSGALAVGGDIATFRTMAYAMTHPQTMEKILTVARQIVKYAPYGPTAAIEVAGGGKKNLERVKEEAAKLKNKPAAAAPAAPPTLPSGITHTFDEQSGQIVPVG